MLLLLSTVVETESTVPVRRRKALLLYCAKGECYITILLVLTGTTLPRAQLELTFWADDEKEAAACVGSTPSESGMVVRRARDTNIVLVQYFDMCSEAIGFQFVSTLDGILFDQLHTSTVFFCPRSLSCYRATGRIAQRGVARCGGGPKARPAFSCLSSGHCAFVNGDVVARRVITIPISVVELFDQFLSAKCIPLF